MDSIDKTSRLLRASANDDAPTVRKLLKENANPNLIVPFQTALSGSTCVDVFFSSNSLSLALSLSLTKTVSTNALPLHMCSKRIDE